ncbi:MAG: 16S rRNA (cytosine(967)-C(5))-methyltransferase RsmB [Defluviitaleaceae bacterium]|nr:16S rRNA (cytosine(967)-C(5))-methyltransferase RsmB [Defluviitaleaceae bacterium]MCL2836152.1 16S rRNA (cytosine(967)-C(5))-methyltransferase RsmB [Defluviitaleaceae bacterium]
MTEGQIPAERGLALEALMGVTAGGYNNIIINKVLSRYPELPRERRAFVTECVNGTLRRLFTLDYIINQVSTTNTRSMDVFILNLLRMSVYQLAFMENQAGHAVCDEAVKLAASSKHAALKGFVNANLRSITQLLPKIIAGIDKIKTADRYAWLEVKFSCQRAVAEVLDREIGEGETELLLDYMNNSRPPVTVCVNTLKTDKDALSGKLPRSAVVSPGLFMENALRLTGLPEIQSLAAFRDGLFHVMDEGAMLAVKGLGLKSGARVLDVCAAPGGKAFMAAYIIGGSGYIEARDIHPHKLDLISAGTKRLGITSVKVKEADATVLDESCVEGFDAVLADVPCSGLGLIGKKPDIRYRFSMAQVSKLQGLQRRILNACAKYVKPGGVLIYSTCTLTAEENGKNAAWFAKTHGFLPDPLPCPVPETAITDDKGHVLLLPHKTGCDGFYIARFIKKG